MAHTGIILLTTDLSRSVVPVSVILTLGLSVKVALISSLIAAFPGAAMMSIRDFFGSDDEDDGGTSEEGGMVFDEGVDDMDDGGLGDFDDMNDDWGDDPGGDGSVGELENRVDELENELASVSSTVSTVKSENEEISDSVDEIEDNVRKLLDIYEMVTRGVNPFVDDAQQGGAFDDGSFGLFEDDGGTDETEEDLDDDIVNAEAESFFDDDFDGEGGGGDDLGGDPFEDDGMEDDGFDDGGFEDDGFEDEGFDETLEDDDGSGDGGGTGKSFDELKSEYESGDAEWAEGEKPPSEDSEEPEPTDEDPEDDGFGMDDAEEAFGDDGFGGSDPPEDHAFGASTDFEETSENGDSPAQQRADPTPAEDSEAPGEFGGSDDIGDSNAATATGANGETAEAAGDGGSEWEQPTEEPSADAMAVPSSDRPYLTDLEGGYVTDMVVMEWMTYLVEESGPLEAYRAIKYYEDVEWINGTVADRLWNFLDGYPKDTPEDALPPRDRMSYPSELTVDHHIRSLSFIANLAGDQQRELFDRWNRRGEPNALQH